MIQIRQSSRLPNPSGLPCESDVPFIPGSQQPTSTFFVSDVLPSLKIC